MSRIPRTEMQHLQDLLRICIESQDSRVAMQATCLRNRLAAIEREARQVQVDKTALEPANWWGAC